MHLNKKDKFLSECGQTNVGRDEKGTGTGEGDG